MENNKDETQEKIKELEKIIRSGIREEKQHDALVRKQKEAVEKKKQEALDKRSVKEFEQKKAEELETKAIEALKRENGVLRKILNAFGTTSAILICILFLALLGGVIYVYSIIKDAPQIDTGNIDALLSENSVLYDDKGNVLDSVFLESKRTNVSYSSLPENLKNAFIAVEDKTFWSHHGFNIVRIIGAVREGLKSGDKISGTSTITQQLARNLYLMDIRSEYSVKRKMVEAYYTILLENDLTKEQILEAYLNRVSLGFGTAGVQAASQAYFAKNVSELTLSECVALAAIIQEPNSYALVKTLPNANVSDDNENIIYRDNTYAYLYNTEASEKRRRLILDLMLEQGLITGYEHRRAAADDIREHIKPFPEEQTENISYFTDYAIREVVNDLSDEYGVSETKAWDMLFNGGLHIYTTVDVSMQGIVESEFAKNENFPGTANIIRDRAGNIIKPSGGILLYLYGNYFDEDGDFVITPDEYEMLDNGGVLLYSGKRLNFYRTETNGQVDNTINFKSMYLREDGVFNTISEGTVAIPAEYKYKDTDGNLIIAPKFFKENPDFFEYTEAGLILSPGNYSLKQKVVQPQAAMVILDYKTGAIKAMAGGRGTEGRLLYNRAANPRQPGSAIKPISVYGPALQSAADDINGVKPYEPKPFTQLTPPIVSHGKYWTAASVINDRPLYLNEKIWPKNWYSGNRGPATLRTSVEQSINVNAVKVFSLMGPEYSLDFLKKLGVSTIVEGEGTNDINPAALALGGMTVGISPLEMAGAYGTFANGGFYNKPVSYTKVVGRNGEILIDNSPKNVQVMDPGAAFIMTDILRTTITRGFAWRASVPGRTVAGKTGTTSDNYDAWFVGITPEYAASLWIGNDVNIELSEGSLAAARLWSKIMIRVLDGLPVSTFQSAPPNVVYSSGEYFIAGTQWNPIYEGSYSDEENEDAAAAEGEEGNTEEDEVGESDAEPAVEQAGEQNGEPAVEWDSNKTNGSPEEGPPQNNYDNWTGPI